ncbi:tRNA (adenosine(37)-N6)-dimethylallyltransferase MiaA [Sphingomicrobium astaxanthinifaciens]|uniref:tRNA (adenosine(37)-N6)-dimethylallyltransferase MiaA n=1 Tax=Sphingomicrobium astaxanthinifaciens TaxID=1227949 RepID=UPI001FCC0BC5|nr:tRNA (adenosine(37)-N6)-dimethylallyltransferase MiaA [Sphingomicrobium astaxanthinifaciens]MCJ7420284.1 tRNA (adenosine(37)-N6)-dimethylallyltransferase MiaA [Sphingomicrobium astaxanthinifaciens]
MAMHPPLALIAGPTASGKSELALRLAEAKDGVVINADSAQIYADLSILAASPSPGEQARAPHRLYGVRDGALPCSAADWAALAKQEIAVARAAGKLPILVGGTGLYLRTLLDGIAPVPEIDPAIRAAVRDTDTASNYAALATEDPAAAARLNPGDSLRIARALEVVRSTGHPLSYWQARKEGGIGGAVTLRPLLLLPPRDWLAARCDRRFETMVAAGAIEEVTALLARGLDPALPVMRAIGVPELAAHLAGETSLDDAIAAAQRATRQYMKRQYTWFRRQPPADWPRFSDPLDSDDALARALALLAPPA